jgi:hypothetical protein
MIAGVVFSSFEVLPFLDLASAFRIFVATAPSTSITGAVDAALPLPLPLAVDFALVEVLLALAVDVDFAFVPADRVVDFPADFFTFIFSAMLIGPFF